MKPIFLIGFMCSGKSTLGRALADASGMDFFDLDDLVEQRMGMTISEIFSTYGEDRFRREEQAALAEVASRTDVIIACGGGTPCRPGAMETMNSRGLTVFLQPEEHRHVERLMLGRAGRPLLSGIHSASDMLHFLRTRMAQRMPFYTLAATTFDSSRLETPEEIHQTAKDFINAFVTF